MKIFITGILLLLFIWQTQSDVHAAVNNWEKLSAPNYIHKVITTPYGLIGAEYSDDPEANSANNVWLGKKAGENWIELGLRDAGITDVTFFDGKLYAATLFETTNNAGLFVSQDAGGNWQIIFQHSPATKVYVDEQVMLVGTYEQGVWASFNNGSSWQKKIDVEEVTWYPIDNYGGLGDSKITGIFRLGSKYFVGTTWGNYVSSNGGRTWYQYNDLTDPLVTIVTNDAFWFGCTLGSSGLWETHDSGVTWQENNAWGITRECHDMLYYQGRYYAYAWGVDSRTDLFYSEDSGSSWQHSYLNATEFAPMSSLALYKGEKDYLLAAGNLNGVWRYNVPKPAPSAFAFLSKLWARTSIKEQTATITSYFDHAYPLLGYYLHQEPVQERSTTLNYMGQKAKEPLLYYSSHDGIDFGLKYGTPILAPASGYGTYSYSAITGHQIKIDHQNYFQTIYMHLQDKELITKGSTQIWVNKGDKIGLVGMTGNTTGPHLHFSVVSDANKNGNFADDNPHGRVDPYSWLVGKTPDPWEKYTWNDSLGFHRGSVSKYLWLEDLPTIKKDLDSLGGAAADDGLSVEIPANALENEATLSLSAAAQIKAQMIESTKILLKGTAYIIELTDPTGGLIHNIRNVANLAFNLTSHEFENININTLAFYYFDEALEAWQELESIWNETTKTLTAQTNHFSEFAIFAEKIDSLPPITSYELSEGQKEDGWYIQHPVMDLMSYDPNIENNIEIIFYSVDGGSSWNEYANPFSVTRNGVYAILYRAQDKNENLEETKQTELLRINTSGNFFDEGSFLDAIFTTSNDFSL